MPSLKNIFRERTILRIITAFALDLFGISAATIALGYELFTPENASPGLGWYQVLLCVLGLLVSVCSGFMIPPPQTWHKILTGKTPSILAAISSLILFGINITGLFIPLRNPEVYQETSYAGISRRVKYPARQVFKQMNRIEAIDEQYPDYVKRLTQLIFDGTIHYWPEEKENSFNHYLPLHENYLIYFLRAYRGIDEPYEFCRAERAIERAASVCSQSSKIMANILARNKVRAQIITLDGHVIVRARVEKEPETWWILDADFGVVIEEDLNRIIDDPEIIHKAYAARGYDNLVIENLINIYAPEGNQAIDDQLLCHDENQLYLLKWLIPITGLLPLTMFWAIHKLWSVNDLVIRNPLH